MFILPSITFRPAMFVQAELPTQVIAWSLLNNGSQHEVSWVKALKSREVLKILSIPHDECHTVQATHSPNLWWKHHAHAKLGDGIIKIPSLFLGSWSFFKDLKKICLWKLSKYIRSRNSPIYWVLMLNCSLYHSLVMNFSYCFLNFINLNPTAPSILCNLHLTTATMLSKPKSLQNFSSPQKCWNLVCCVSESFKFLCPLNIKGKVLFLFFSISHLLHAPWGLRDDSNINYCKAHWWHWITSDRKGFLTT